MSKKGIFWFLVIATVLVVAGIWLFDVGKQHLAGTMSHQMGTEKKSYTIGVVYSGGAYQQALDGLQSELAKKGFTEGKNVTFVIKNTVGNTQFDEAVVKEILSKNPTLIYTVSTPITSQVQKFSPESMPIVFNIVGDPVGGGFVKNYSAPETNLTGCSNLSAELSGKRLGIFKKAFPNIQSVVTFYDPSNKFSVISIENTRKTAEALKVKLTEIKVKDKDELSKALDALKPGEFNGIYITPDAMVVSNADLVVKKATELKIPTMGHEETLADKGVSLTYGANFYRLGVQCASVVTDILGGKKPQNEPVRTPEKLDITINAKNLDAIKANISPEVQNMADKVIR